MACVQRMTARTFEAGETMYEPGSIGTTLVRSRLSALSCHIEQPRVLPRRFVLKTIHTRKRLTGPGCAQQVFVERGEAECYRADSETVTLAGGGFYGEDSFITSKN